MISKISLDSLFIWSVSIFKLLQLVSVLHNHMLEICKKDD